ncbi:FAD-dependent oxidoreductase [Candidatus Micrarchaeota archaeon]|nr:FAD-dependent oxidoreductase [Candidatus Micrarchaeota archaeon]
MFDLIIIGGGPSGLAAAMYGGRVGIKTLLISELPGGNMNFASWIENYPGFESIQGSELAEKFRAHAVKYNAEFKDEKATKVERKGQNFIVAGEAGYEAKSIIFATGTTFRKLGVPGEKEFDGKGVHYCALCDGPLYTDKVIAVVGGSNSAVKEAILLAEYGKKVYVISRSEQIKCENCNYEKASSNPKIEFIYKTNVVGIKGDKLVKSIMLDAAYKGKKELAVDAVFIEIGRIPASELAKKLGVAVNEKGEIITDKESKTNLPGVFAAGDVTNSSAKQVITGAAEGVKAAYSAYAYLKSK